MNGDHARLYYCLLAWPPGACRRVPTRLLIFTHICRYMRQRRCGTVAAAPMHNDQDVRTYDDENPPLAGGAGAGAYRTPRHATPCRARWGVESSRGGTAGHMPRLSRPATSVQESFLPSFPGQDHPNCGVHFTRKAMASVRGLSVSSHIICA